MGGGENMDIRLPMGLMFSIIGAIIAAYGMFTTGSPIYAEHSLGININLWWGLVMLLFGLFLLYLVRIHAARIAALPLARVADDGPPPA